MANLLAKFRIDYSSLTMVQDIMEAPQAETRKMFDDLVAKFADNASEGM
jgi:solute carrier family 12 sodium/potassium/chloride transporter 2